METFEEAVLREVFEETGIRPVRTPRLLTVINIPGKNKNHIGAIFQTSFGYDELSHLHPQDTSEIEAVRVFTDKELFELLNTPDAINRPQFNKGLIAWWWRNEHRDVWDPHRGTEPEDKGISLDEIYLKKWA
jgi:NADH pyrophosphatase NudC (nudix superfamily)